MAKSEYVFDVGDKEFQEKVVDRSKETPVVVDFWAPWCGPCRSLAPVLEKLIDERKGEILMAKVNIDEEQRLAADFGIQSIPAVIAFKGGRPFLDFMGLLPEVQIREFLDRVGPSEMDRQAKAASLLEKDDPTQAEKTYREVLAKDRNQESAIIGLARIVLDRGDFAEATELLDQIGDGDFRNEAEKLKSTMWLRELVKELPDEKALGAQVTAEPKNALARYQLGLRLAAQEKYPEALETLLSAGERDMKLASTKVREAMVQVFHLIGDTSPLANEYRAKLSTMLY